MYRESNPAQGGGRLFAGLWPPPAARAAIERHAGDWHWLPAARRTAPEKLHVTLHFLGALPPGQAALLADALALPWAGCALRLDRAEVWPGGIAVLEANEVPPALADLHARMGAALRQCGIAVDARRLRPHVTLARKGQGSRPPQRFDAIEWDAGPQFVLARSLPGRGYEPVQVFG